MKFYEIDEEAARSAKQANSHFDYVEGSATRSYQSKVMQVEDIADAYKEIVDPMYHEKIDALLDSYANRLAKNRNAANRIAARVPSIMVAGGSNFNNRAKEKQNAARDKNMLEYLEIEKIPALIRMVGTGGIKSDDPQAVDKLRKVIAEKEAEHTRMKAANAFFRKHKTLDGCPFIEGDGLRRAIAERLEREREYNPQPYETYSLTNNSVNIRNMKARLASLEKAKSTEPSERGISGVKFVSNKVAMRIQIFFEEKPDEDTRKMLRSNGFLWAPSVGAWQRQLTENGERAAARVFEAMQAAGQTT